jgi:hypothetical protein
MMLPWWWWLRPGDEVALAGVVAMMRGGSLLFTLPLACRKEKNTAPFFQNHALLKTNCKTA